MRVPSESPSFAGRAFLAIALMIGFYGLAISIAAFLLYLPYAELMYADRIHVKLLIGCVAGAAIVLWSIVPRADRFVAPGPRLVPGQQPRLFELLESISRATGQTMPREVYLVPDVNAFVTSRGGIMGFGSRRVMGLGLPLMQILTVSQFRAVICHEFGHYHGGDVSLGPWIHKTRTAIGRTVKSLAEADSNILKKPFEWYGLVFLRVTQAISRAQEFAADALAARVCGATHLIEGLKRVDAAAFAYPHYFLSEVLPILDRGRRPPIAEGLTGFLSASGVQRTMKMVTETELEKGQTHAFDSHPSTKDRIAALESIPPAPTDQATPDADEPAISLLEDISRLEGELLAQMFSNPEAVMAMEPVAWEEAGREVFAPWWAEQAEQTLPHLLPCTAGSLPVDRVRIEHLGRAVAEACNANPDEVDPHAIGSSFLVATIFHLLVETGWQPEALPGQSGAVVMDDRRITFAESTLALLREKLEAPGAWVAFCREKGIHDLQIPGTSAPDAKGETHEVEPENRP